MKRLKAAKAKVVTYELECPYCDGYLASPDGPLSWEIYRSAPSTGTCVDCGQTSKVPARVPGVDIPKEE